MRQLGRKFLHLTRTEQALFLQSIALLPWIGLATNIFGFAAIQGFLERPSRRRRLTNVETDAQVAALARMVEAAGRWSLFRASCLHRSLLLWWLLERRGVASEIHIGVRCADGNLEAHAWVERFGQALNDRADLRRGFAAFATAIHPSRASFR